MKKAEVKIGGKYYANVTGKKVEIQIDSEKPNGGWNATNLATGKKILVKSAQRLQGEVAKSKSNAKRIAGRTTRRCKPGCGSNQTQAGREEGRGPRTQTFECFGCCSQSFVRSDRALERPADDRSDDR
jgi:hypothetical protein